MGKISEALGTSSAARDYYKQYTEKREQTDKLIEECKFTIGKNTISFKAVDGVLTVFVGNLTLTLAETIDLAQGLLKVLREGK